MFSPNLCDDQHDEQADEESGALKITPAERHGERSPPVSPSVVAAILMIQKTRVTSGTLLSASCFNVSFIGESAPAAGPITAASEVIFADAD
jgi:hypothetical protein